MVHRYHSLGDLDEIIGGMYNTGLSLKSWSHINVPDEDLIYKGGLSKQCRKADAVAALLYDNQSSGLKQFEVIYLPVEARVVGSHTSKSVKLPVTCFKLNYFNQVIAYVFLRDNFHDIKVSVISDSPMTIPYELAHYEYSEERFQKEKERYLSYHPTETGIKLMAEGSDDWFNESWSSDTILRKNGRIYRAGTVASCYCEGIERLGLPPEVFQVYQDDMKMFTCSVSSYAKVAMLLEHVQASLRRERSKRCVVWNDQKRAEEKENEA